jgi:hypothetical protein
MPIAQAVFIATRICDGLDYAHRKKEANGAALSIVHRDVSPQNILMSYDGEVKIIDFGIAKAANRAQKTQAGILKGKFGYMSPEQVQGLAVDHRSDLFAVGVTLYEMLTGERLFVGESDFSTLERVRVAEVPPPRLHNVEVPEELERIILKALAREAADRYPWCSDLRDDLLRFVRSSESTYSSKQLSQYLRQAFAEDCARERERLERFATMVRPDPIESSGGTKPQPAPVGRQPTPAKPRPVPVGRQPTAGPASIRAPAVPLGRRPTPAPAAQQPESESAERDRILAGRTVVYQPAREEENPPSSASDTAPGTHRDSHPGGDDQATRVPNAQRRPGAPTVLELPIQELPGADDIGSATTFIGLRAPRARTDKVAVDGADERSVPAATTGPADAAPQGHVTAHESQGEAPSQRPARSSRPLLIVAGALAGAAAVTAAIVGLGSPAPGRLVVLAEPSQATVTVDGRRVALGELLELVPGPHVVEAQAPGFDPYQKSFTLVAGAQVSIEAALTAKAPPASQPGSDGASSPDADTSRPETVANVGARSDAQPAEGARRFDLRIESQPPGAEIEIGGRRFGGTPKTLRSVDPAEVRSVTLSLKGYRSAKAPVRWNGERREVAILATLERLQRPEGVGHPREQAADHPVPKPGVVPVEPGAERAAERSKDRPKARGAGKLVTLSSPVARVAVDGKDTGRWTPISPSQPLEIASGDHLVTYTDNEGRKAIRKITIATGEVVKITGVTDFQ